MTDYKKINDYTLKVTDSLQDGGNDWGAPRLTRLFNFRSKQVTAIYERGGLEGFNLPRGGSSYQNEKGYTAAVTSAMQIQNFRDIEDTDEIAAMHRKLSEMGGRPPALDDTLQKQKLAPPALNA